MASLPRITEESASSRKGSDFSSTSGPRGSASSLKRGTTGLTGAYIPPFNFEAAKAKVEKGFSSHAPRRFTRYFKTACFDKLARACLQHFLAVVEQQILSKALYRARRQQIENVNMLVITAHQGNVAKEAREQLAEISSLYAVVILEQSSSMQPGEQFRPHQEDNRFFEAMFQAIADIIQEAFPRHPYSDIEAHLGMIFRTSCFNITGHRQEAPQLADVIPLHELVELKQGLSRKDPIAAKRLNALNSRTKCTNYRVASQTNTDIVASLLRPSRAASNIFEDRQSTLLGDENSAAYCVPAKMLDPTDPADNAPVSTDRAGMIIDAQLKQLRLLKSALAGRIPSTEGMNSRQGSTMRNLSMLRGSLRPQASSFSIA